MTQLDIITTKDGSPSVYSHLYKTEYHSKHGALTEALHVYIQNGLNHVIKNKQNLTILEMGFGTGLNAYLTYKHLPKHIIVTYYGVEQHPMGGDELKKYWDSSPLEYVTIIEDLHNKNPNGTFVISNIEKKGYENKFKIIPIITNIESAPLPQNIDLIYYDAFGPYTQPELWTPSLFKKLWNVLSPGGVWVSFCAKSQVKRDLKALGFTVETLPGPPGKREMTRATKPI